MCKKSKAVAFIDLLGFSHYVSESMEYSIDMLSQWSNVLSFNFLEDKMHPPKKYKKSLRELAEQTAVTSFENFLPFSDCVYITSTDPNLFIKQLSNFIHDVFIYNGYNFRDPINNNNPENINIKEFTSLNSYNEKVIKSYPLMLRGGISYGEVQIIKSFSLSNGNLSSTPNIIGKAVISAYNLEKRGKGPKILIDDTLFDSLQPENKKYVKTEEGIHYLLWPVFALPIDGKTKDDFIFKSSEFLKITINLWKAYKNPEISQQYLEFMRLVYNSVVFVANEFYNLDSKQIIDDINTYIQKENIDLSLLNY